MISKHPNPRFRFVLLGVCMWIGWVVGETGGTGFKPPINDTIERGAIYKECKTCPYTLCTNAPMTTWPTDDPEIQGVTLECWTRGTSVGNDTTWLRTTDGCYLSQYDLTDRNSSWEDDLSYCGKDSEEYHITLDSATTRYDTECDICPVNIDCVPIKYLKYETDIEVTCWTDLGWEILGNPVWLKTTDNCYVAEVGLWEPANRDILDNCGPIPFLEVNSTYIKRSPLPQPTTLSLPPSQNQDKAPEPTEPPTPPAPLAPPQSQSLKSVSAELEKRYLVEFTIGEEYSYCRDCPQKSCEIDRIYQFNQSVVVQCWLLGDTVWEDWYRLTDFCWIPANDTWEDIHDYYYYPTCADFGDTDGVPPTDGNASGKRKRRIGM